MAKPFISHMNKAWFDAVEPIKAKRTEDHGQFANYFLGWPVGRATMMEKIFVYLFTLRFTVAFLNLVRRPIEFVLNAVAETFAWAKESLRESDNKVFQGFSWVAAGFQGLFDLASGLVRATLSPVTHVACAHEGIQRNRDNPVRRLSWTIAAFAPILIIFPAVMFPPLGLALASCWIVDSIDQLTDSYLLDRPDEVVIVTVTPMVRAEGAANGRRAGNGHRPRPAAVDNATYVPVYRTAPEPEVPTQETQNQRSSGPTQAQ